MMIKIQQAHFSLSIAELEYKAERYPSSQVRVQIKAEQDMQTFSFQCDCWFSLNAINAFRMSLVGLQQGKVQQARLVDLSERVVINLSTGPMANSLRLEFLAASSNDDRSTTLNLQEQIESDLINAMIHDLNDFCRDHN